ncbi:MAG TPA: hypothetical protein VI248_29435 [Kineosporiaceae bacterium]
MAVAGPLPAGRRCFRAPRPRPLDAARAGLVALLLGGCASACAASTVTATTSAASAAAPSGSAAGTIPEGPGPTSPYTVQPQPAPGTCRYRYDSGYPLPDPACTPGALNPKVTPATVRTTICRSGYTSSIRPPLSITSREKVANARSYGYTGSTRTAEYDHLISLELGGDPNDPRNLWVQPNDDRAATTTANRKDSVENAAHSAVCDGRLTLAEVQTGIAADWVALGRRLGLSLPEVR